MTQPRRSPPPSKPGASKTNTTAKPASEAEWHARAERAEAALVRHARTATKVFAHQVMLAQDRRDFARRELGKCKALLDQVRPHLGHPDADLVFAQTTLRATIYLNLHAMMTVDLDCHAFNLELAETPALLDHERFRFPEQRLPYLVARANMDLALAQYYWMRYLPGIDALLRACRSERAIEPASAEVEARLQAASAKLRAAFKGDRTTAMYAGTLAASLAETRELMTLGTERQQALVAAGPQHVREIMLDPSWKMLNGKVQTLLSDLPARVQERPLLAELFPRTEAASLPFTMASEARSPEEELEELLSAMASDPSVAPPGPPPKPAPVAKPQPGKAPPSASSREAMLAAMAAAAAAASAAKAAPGPARPRIKPPAPSRPPAARVPLPPPPRRAVPSPGDPTETG